MLTSSLRRVPESPRSSLKSSGSPSLSPPPPTSDLPSLAPMSPNTRTLALNGNIFGGSLSLSDIAPDSDMPRSSSIETDDRGDPQEDDGEDDGDATLRPGVIRSQLDVLADIIGGVDAEEEADLPNGEDQEVDEDVREEEDGLEDGTDAGKSE